MFEESDYFLHADAILSPWIGNCLCIVALVGAAAIAYLWIRYMMWAMKD